MPRTSARCALTLALSLMVASCAGGTEPGAEWAGTTNTLANGRVVVTSPDVPLEPTWGLVEELRVGALESEGPDLFGQINGIELGAGGEVYILDGQASEVRVFDAHGGFQRAMGRRGEGPGELMAPSGLALDSEGILWVMNWRNARYTGFNPATGEVQSEPRRHISYAALPWAGQFQSGDLLVDVGLDRDGQPAILRLDAALEPSDTLAIPASDDSDLITYARNGVRIATMPQPFAPQAQWTPRPQGGVVMGNGADYSLHRVTFEGDTTLTMTLERAPVPVSAAERDTVLAAYRERESYLDGAAPDRDLRPRSSKPAHGFLHVDDQDRTWVRGATPAGTETVWDLFGADGRYLTQVPVPDAGAIFMFVVRGDRLAVVSQAEGYPQVVVYRLVAGEG